MDPRRTILSKSIPSSRDSSVKHPPDGPPVWIALNFLPSLMPPPISKISSRSVVPIEISTRPMLLTLPPRQNTFVPGDFSVPYFLNSSTPSRRMNGTVASVSTLFRTVGFCHRPETAGKGGRGRGIPRLPMIEFRRAVSSPQTNAPAPRRTCAWKLNPEPRMLSPRSPCSSMVAIMLLTCSTARGYSARM